MRVDYSKFSYSVDTVIENTYSKVHSSNIPDSIRLINRVEGIDTLFKPIDYLLFLINVRLLNENDILIRYFSTPQYYQDTFSTLID